MTAGVGLGVVVVDLRVVVVVVVARVVVVVARVVSGGRYVGCGVSTALTTILTGALVVSIGKLKGIAGFG